MPKRLHALGMAGHGRHVKRVDIRVVHVHVTIEDVVFVTLSALGGGLNRM